MTEARRWEDVKAELDELYDKDAWARAAYEQYTNELTIEQRAYWESVGAHGGVIE